MLLLLAAALNLVPGTFRLSIVPRLQTVLLLPARAAATVLHTLSVSSQDNRRLSQLAVELAVENARLRSTARIRADVRSGRITLRPATVVARDLQAFGHWLVLSTGTTQGVVPGSPVLTPEGLVGVVTNASNHQSLVQTLLNPGLRVAVLDTRTRVPAVARTGPGEVLDLDYVPTKSDIAAGDTLVTAGLGAVFPKGLRVATVVSVSTDPNALFLRVTARPFVNVRRLEEVFVLLIPDSLVRSDSSGWLVNITLPESAASLPLTDKLSRIR